MFTTLLAYMASDEHSQILDSIPPSVVLLLQGFNWLSVGGVLYHAKAPKHFEVLPQATC